MNHVERLRAAMVDRLTAAGNLHSRPWMAAFRQIPRHLFLRRFFRQNEDLSGWEAVSATDPGALEMIYSDATWVTQLDSDPGRWWEAHETGTPVPGVPTSSSSAPGLMGLMLEALDVRERDAVLEIGTGTGYHAALLCHRLGSPLVTTVELDPSLAVEAREALHTCGYAPTVAVADGTEGDAAGGPFHRLIATCSVPAVPPAWIAQLRPGGLIATSLHRDLSGGALVLLRVDADGQAQGRFLPHYGSFMPVRAHPPADAAARLTAALDTHPPDSGPRTAMVPPAVLDNPDFGMIAALRLPGVASIEFEPAGGPQRWLLGDDGSWACLDEPTSTVSQHGARRLWDELEALHGQWRQRGAPARERIGLTVTGSGDHLFWVDNPQSMWWGDQEGWG